jgi:hypothetical protein
LIDVYPFVLSIFSIVTGKALGEDLSVQSLRADGNEAVFIGIGIWISCSLLADVVGLPHPKLIPAFEGLSEDNGFFTSKTFLPKVFVCLLLHMVDDQLASQQAWVLLLQVQSASASWHRCCSGVCVLLSCLS